MWLLTPLAPVPRWPRRCVCVCGPRRHVRPPSPCPPHTAYPQLHRSGFGGDAVESHAMVLACLMAAIIHAHALSPPPHADDVCMAARIERSWPSLLALASAAPSAASLLQQPARALRQWLSLALRRFANASRASALSRRSSSGSAMPKDLALIEGALYPRLLKDKSSMSHPSPPCPSLALVTPLSQYRRHVVAVAPAPTPQIAAAAAVQVGGCVPARTPLRATIAHTCSSSAARGLSFTSLSAAVIGFRSGACIGFAVTCAAASRAVDVCAVELRLSL